MCASLECVNIVTFSLVSCGPRIYNFLKSAMINVTTYWLYHKTSWRLIGSELVTVIINSMFEEQKQHQGGGGGGRGAV